MNEGLKIKIKGRRKRSDPTDIANGKGGFETTFFCMKFSLLSERFNVFISSVPQYIHIHVPHYIALSLNLYSQVDSHSHPAHPQKKRLGL